LRPPLMSNARVQHLTAVQIPEASIPGTVGLELTAQHAPLLQRFFEANPEYFLATTGEPAGPGEALDEITGEVPVGMSFTKKWVIGYADAAGDLVALVNVITDLPAVSVFHIGTFIVATERHGSGDAQALHGAVEFWAIRNGAAWLRLGVVQGNTRAERFWNSQGYLPVRPRPDIPMGRRSVTVRNMVKPLTGETLETYFRLVARDRPGTEA